MAVAYHSSYFFGSLLYWLLKKLEKFEKQEVSLSPNNFKKLSVRFQKCWYKENTQFACYV